MILGLLQVELDEDATSADRLRAIYGTARDSVPGFIWNGLRILPKAGDVLQGIDAWLESATADQADELLERVAEELLQLRSAGAGPFEYV